MKDYGRIKSSHLPESIKINATTVEIATNVTPFSYELEDETVTGYEYNYVIYDIGEYIKLMDETNSKLEADLLDTQVALCDLYEMIEGGD